jgi:hypothetical protein
MAKGGSLSITCNITINVAHYNTAEENYLKYQLQIQQQVQGIVVCPEALGEVLAAPFFLFASTRSISWHGHVEWTW